MSRKIRLLLPKGSLNQPDRGDTSSLIKQAGYNIAGYEPGKESDKGLIIRNDPEIEAMLSRPQSAPNELLLGMADVAIVGSDWVQKEANGNGIVEVADLEFGKTRLVFAVPLSCQKEGLENFVADQAYLGLICFTEYVNTAARAIAATKAYQGRFSGTEPVRQLRGVSVGDNDRIRVIMSDGVTEGYIKKGANLVLDNTQTGSTLTEYGLRELEQIAESTARLYASEKAMSDTWKRGKIEEIAAQLRGVVEARKRDYVAFNVPNDRLQPMLTYLARQELFSDEPTQVPGRNFTQISVLVPKARWPKISRELQGYGATNIIRYTPQQVIS